MDNLVDLGLFNGIYKDRKVLITGNTGFKGSWLSYWLVNMGADVLGYALKPPTNPNHHEILDLKNPFVTGDIRNLKNLRETMESFNPDIVFHLAAQPFVLYSYENPVLTYDTNIIGTLNILESARSIGSVKALVNITSDKCYENREWEYGYRENDRLGGHDPYSNSKACSELVTSSYRKSFYKDKVIASARAGNVVGGGDWGMDRLIPDIVANAAINSITKIRNPLSIRPWQHVLEPLSGYLLLGQNLLEGRDEFACAWNFGPDEYQNESVQEIAFRASETWNKIRYELNPNLPDVRESGLLALDCSSARTKLHWSPVWNLEETIDHTIKWYRDYYEGISLNTSQNLIDYITGAQKKNLIWT